MTDDEQQLPSPHIELGLIPGRKDVVALRLTVPLHATVAKNIATQLLQIAAQAKTGLIVPEIHVNMDESEEGYDGQG